MRVLMVHNYYKKQGGEDTVFQNEIKNLKNHGHTVFQYTRSNKEIDTFTIIQKIMLPFQAVFAVKTYLDIIQIIKANKIEVVHVHNTLTLISPSAFWAAKHCKIPVVQTLHNFRMECPNALFYRGGKICEECLQRGLFCSVRHKCYRNSTIQTALSALILFIHRAIGTYRFVNFICLTDFNKQKLLQIKPFIRKPIKEENIYVKPNFVFLSEMKVDSPKKRNQYIFVGRLDKFKGIQLLIEAFLKTPNCNLIVCGTGPEEEWCKYFIKKNHIKNIQLVGQVSKEEVFKYIAESKAMIFPNQCYESFGMNVIESICIGTWTVVNDIGNPKSLIKENENGNVMKLSTVNDIVNAIVRIEDNLKNKNKVTIDNQYLSEENHNICMLIYQDIIRKMKE